MLAESRSRRALWKYFSMNRRVWVPVFLSIMLVGCGRSKQQEAPAQEAAPTATPQQQSAPQYTVQELPGSLVEGRVLLQGAPPPPKKIQVTQDIDACGKTREVYPVRVENGGVDDAVVWIDDIQRGKAFAFPPAQIEQKNCTYVPHVVVMQVGDVKISSRDAIPHNVHTYAKNNQDYNESMNQLRRDISLSFPRPDVISVRCDLHGWMQAYAVVAKNPYYAISENGGKFKLDGVPPGHYHLKVWSEKLGESEQEIVVETGKPTKAIFTLKSQTAQGSGAN
jgi:plastocyanin